MRVGRRKVCDRGEKQLQRCATPGTAPTRRTPRPSSTKRVARSCQAAEPRRPIQQKTATSARRLDVQQLCPVFPRNCFKEVGRRQPLQQRESLSGNALVFESRRRRYLTCASPVAAWTVAAEHELLPVPRKKARGELRITGQRVPPGIGGQVPIDVGIISQ